jgi:hypothetical protein
LHLGICLPQKRLNSKEKLKPCSQIIFPLLSKYGKVLNSDGFIGDCARISPKSISPLTAGWSDLCNHTTKQKARHHFAKKMEGLTAVFICIAFIREYFFRDVDK